MTWHREGPYNVLKSEGGEVLGFVRPCAVDGCWVSCRGPVQHGAPVIYHRGSEAEAMQDAENVLTEGLEVKP